MMELNRDGPAQIAALNKKYSELEIKYTVNLGEKERLERIIGEAKLELDVVKNSTSLIRKNWQVCNNIKRAQKYTNIERNFSELKNGTLISTI